jgi:iron complex outermembrane recepter protein
MRRVAVSLMLAGASPAAWAQQAPPPQPAEAAPTPDEGEEEGGEVVVTGSRTPPGSAIGDIPPEQVLGPADIRSYGVTSVSELLTELGPQVRSGRGGQPVVLLNGRRISSFAEIRDLPTEAFQRVDILPEEVALKYGYRADQRVVNFVLRRRFRATTVEAADRIATEGGRNAPQGSAGLFTIRNGERVNLTVDYREATALFESERGVLSRSLGGEGGDTGEQPVDDADQSLFRTLLPSTRTFSANGTYARDIGRVGASVNARMEVTDSKGLLGLPTLSLLVPAGPFADDATGISRVLTDQSALGQDSRTVNGHIGATANGDFGRWRWSLTGNYDRVHTESFTGTGPSAAALQARLDALDPATDPYGALDVAPGPANQAYSTSTTGDLDALLSGPVLALPAGDVSTSIRLGATTSDLSSRSVRGGLDQTGQVSRDVGSGQVNLDLPVASRAKGVLPFLGNLSVNGNVAVDELSDFGTLVTWGYGVNWRPVEAVRLLASVIEQDEAPSAAQLGNPVLVTPAVRVFDYVRGETATVTTVTGGNPLLASDHRQALKLGANIKPFSRPDLTLQVDYNRVRVDDPIASFPAATAEIASVFPGRFTRDAAGALVRLDTRPVNFAATDRSEIRYGFNLSVPLKSDLQKKLEAFRAGTGPNPFEGLRPPSGGPRPEGGGGQRGPGGGFGGGRFGRGGGPGGGGGRLQFALYHTWHLTDRVLVADGGPALDLLNGDAIGSSGGQPRHELEGQAGYTNNGLGARLSVNWQRATEVDGGTAAAPDPLRFSDLATVNLRLFADLGQRIAWVRAHPWLRGARVTLSVDNLFNERQRVTDSAGTVPLSYQPGLLDPIGRTVRLSIRKVFF